MPSAAKHLANEYSRRLAAKRTLEPQAARNRSECTSPAIINLQGAPNGMTHTNKHSLPSRALSRSGQSSTWHPARSYQKGHRRKNDLSAVLRTKARPLAPLANQNITPHYIHPLPKRKTILPHPPTNPHKVRHLPPFQLQLTLGTSLLTPLQ